LLNRLSNSDYKTESVFKGGTSLSKCYGLIDRFSEDVDIAIINEDGKTGNEIKNLIRGIEKKMTEELTEVQEDEITSKGSMFRKTVHKYDSTDEKNENNKLIVEINSFSNPFPYQTRSIKSMVCDFLQQTGNTAIIQDYGLQSFDVNVLDKEQTLIEKLVSLIRFSYDDNPVESIKKKVRHFYDLHFLMKDPDCVSFVNSDGFKGIIKKFLAHDKDIFDDPSGWKNKTINESPFLSDFNNIWNQIKSTYNNELSALAYSTIPSEEEVSQSFTELIKHIQ
jgi:predicted nucleotidyltransferase component of viral defense system